jgi:hypothetical protein
MPNGPAGSLCRSGRHFALQHALGRSYSAPGTEFFLEAPGIWRTVVPSGQFDLQVIGEGTWEGAAVRTYSGKTFHPRWTIDNTITSTELQEEKVKGGLLTASGSGHSS